MIEATFGEEAIQRTKTSTPFLGIILCHDCQPTLTASFQFKFQSRLAVYVQMDTSVVQEYYSSLN